MLVFEDSQTSPTSSTKIQVTAMSPHCRTTRKISKASLKHQCGRLPVRVNHHGKAGSWTVLGLDWASAAGPQD